MTPSSEDHEIHEPHEPWHSATVSAIHVTMLVPVVHHFASEALYTACQYGHADVVGNLGASQQLFHVCFFPLFSSSKTERSVLGVVMAMLSISESKLFKMVLAMERHSSQIPAGIWCQQVLTGESRRSMEVAQ